MVYSVTQYVDFTTDFFTCELSYGIMVQAIM
jgi:hypothetical protein